MKTIKRKVFKDKDGREVTEEEVTDADGKKYKVRTKVYRDADGNEITEEERIDEFGKIHIVLLDFIKEMNRQQSNYKKKER